MIADDRHQRSQTGRTRAITAGLCAGIVLLLGAHSALASDGALIAAYGSGYPAAEAALARASGPDAVQNAYGVARDLQEAVRLAVPVTKPCKPLQSALARYAAARVLQLEGIDRPSPGDTASGRRSAEAARSQISASRGACRPGADAGARTSSLALSPSSGEVFYGTVVAAAPAGADNAQIFDTTTPGPRVRIRAGTARFDVSAWRPGRHDLRVIFAKGNRAFAASTAQGTWLLPRSAQRAVPGSSYDSGLASALTRALAGGPAYRSAWIQNVSTGRSAGVGAGALFPAASTVKLGLLVGVLARLGPRPEDSRFAYDLRALTGWSSNLASNRLVRAFGTGAASDGFRRLGARSSTFTGEYIVGTELQPSLPAAGAGIGPPRASQRVTTAQDLARMLYGIHASAVSSSARRETGLTAHQARLALGWLLASQQRGDNAGLFGAGAPSGSLIAQKNGWLNASRSGASLIYTPRGPVIAVLMTYDQSGVSLASAQALGARVAQLAAR